MVHVYNHDDVYLEALYALYRVFLSRSASDAIVPFVKC